MNFGVDNDQHICQADAGFRLCLVPERPTGSSRNLLSHSHMDTLHCSSDVRGLSGSVQQQCIRHAPLPLTNLRDACASGHGGYTAFTLEVLRCATVGRVGADAMSPITPETAKNRNLHHKCHNRRDLTPHHGSATGVPPGCPQSNTRPPHECRR